MQVHIEALGGLSGDMFIAAMVDSCPELEELLKETFRRLDLPSSVETIFTRITNPQMSGLRFIVHGSDKGFHDHSDIVQFIETADIEPGIKSMTDNIFEILAKAEAQVHGVSIDNVRFQEVGNWGSIIDIILAASIIDHHKDFQWSVGSLPLGEGFANTQHGLIPLPAPATTLLLEGFPVHRDGFQGERVTPTGAAILKHLSPSLSPGLLPMNLKRSGVGFGSRELEGISNVTRVFVFSKLSGWDTQNSIGVIRFYVDDQMPEDLAIGLENIRRSEDVLDVIQLSAVGKKGRLGTSVEVLVEPRAMGNVIECCLNQTSTLGLRWCYETRSTLPREVIDTSIDGERLPVKVAYRPNGDITAKLESDQLANGIGFGGRFHRRSVTERDALSGRKNDQDSD